MDYTKNYKGKGKVSPISIHVVNGFVKEGIHKLQIGSTIGSYYKAEVNHDILQFEI